MNNMLNLLEKKKKCHNLSTIDLLNLYNLTETNNIIHYHNTWDNDNDIIHNSSWHDIGELNCEAKWKQLYTNDDLDKLKLILLDNNENANLIKSYINDDNFDEIKKNENENENENKNKNENENENKKKIDDYIIINYV